MVIDLDLDTVGLVNSYLMFMLCFNRTCIICTIYTVVEFIITLNF